MSKMAELHAEASNLIYKGYTASEVAKMLCVPLSLIEPIEEDLMEMNNPRNYGPDYDQE